MVVTCLLLFCFFRESLLQGVGNKNQDFQNTSQSLSAFLDNLPNNKINPKDSLSQISAKQSSQEVSGVHFSKMANEMISI